MSSDNMFWEIGFKWEKQLLKCKQQKIQINAVVSETTFSV